VTEPNRTARPNQPRRDPVAAAGMVVVAMAAAVLSFSTWVQLAESVGFTDFWQVFEAQVRLAWLLPLAVDCYTMTVIRVWLNSEPGSSVERFAKGNAIGGIGLTVTAQAVYHAFAAAGFDKADLWWFAIVIGGIPPLLFGLAIDLYTRLRRARHTAESSTEPVQLAPPPVATPAAEPAIRPVPLPARKATPKPAAQRTEPANAARPNPPRTDAQLMPTVRRLVQEGIAAKGRPPGIGKVRAQLGINYDRTKELIQRAVTELNQPVAAGINGHEPERVGAL